MLQLQEELRSHTQSRQKSQSFMMGTELTDHSKDPVVLLYRQIADNLVNLPENAANFSCINGIHLCVAVVEKFRNGVYILVSKLRWMLLDVDFELLNIWGHDITSLEMMISHNLCTIKGI